MPFGTYTYGIQWHIVLDGVSAPSPPGEVNIWSQPSIQNMQLEIAAKPSSSPMLPPGEYKWGVGWTCWSDSAFCQITLVFNILDTVSDRVMRDVNICSAEYLDKYQNIRPQQF